MSLALASEEESYLDIRSVRKAAPRTFLHATKTATVKQGEPSAGEHQQGTPSGKDLPAPPVSARDRQFAASGASASLGGLRNDARRGQQADALQNRVRGWQEPRRQTQCRRNQPHTQHKLLP